MTTQTSEFDRPWENPNVPLIIDPYCENPIDWTKLKTEPRVVAIIHKATIGSGDIDPLYFDRKKEANTRGYLWGSYHWGLSGNPEKQADYYIDTVKPDSNEVIALDLEDIESKKFMSAEEALSFAKRTKKITGRYPVIYTNDNCAKILSSKYAGSEFALMPHWYARYLSKVTDYQNNLWPTYTIWQFSCEEKVQILVPGTKPDIDVNVYNGTINELRSKWPLT